MNVILFNLSTKVVIDIQRSQLPWRQLIHGRTNLWCEGNKLPLYILNHKDDETTKLAAPWSQGCRATPAAPWTEGHQHSVEGGWGKEKEKNNFSFSFSSCFFFYSVSVLEDQCLLGNTKILGNSGMPGTLLSVSETLPTWRQDRKYNMIILVPAYHCPSSSIKWQSLLR